MAVNPWVIRQNSPNDPTERWNRLHLEHYVQGAQRQEGNDEEDAVAVRCAAVAHADTEHSR